MKVVDSDGQSSLHVLLVRDDLPRSSVSKMRDRDARVDLHAHCGGREGRLTLEEEQKPLLSPQEPSSTASVCCKEPSTRDVGPLEPVNGCVIDSVTCNLIENGKGLSFSSQVPVVELCAINGSDDCKLQVLPSQESACCSCPAESNDGVVPPPSCETVNKPKNRFFLPIDEDTSDHVTSEGSPVCGLERGRGAPHVQQQQQVSLAGRVGVQLKGPRHVFTVVPVDATELCKHKIDEEPDETEPLLPAAAAAGTTSSSSSCTAPPTCPSSHYNTVRSCSLGRRVGYSPYQTITAGSHGPGHYNPYHTISGMVPCSYQRSENGLFSVPTFSRRQYGIGGSTSLFPRPEHARNDLTPSLAARGSPRTLTASGTVPMGMHRVASSGPAMHVPLRQVFSQEWGGLPTLPDLPPHHLTIHSANHMTVHSNQMTVNSTNQMTVNSANQMTVRSAGTMSVEVGSTDGRSMMVRGALHSPDLLPYIPPVNRYCLTYTP